MYQVQACWALPLPINAAAVVAAAIILTAAPTPSYLPNSIMKPHPARPADDILG